MNVPIGIAAVFLTLSQVEESRDPGARGVDWAGLVTFSGSLFLLVFALVQGNEKGWGSTQIVSFLIGSAVLLTAFLLIERRQERPMLDLSLFRRPAFAGANIVAFAVSSSMFSMFLYLTLSSRTCSATSRCPRACASCRSRCCRSLLRRCRAACPCAYRCGCCSARA